MITCAPVFGMTVSFGEPTSKGRRIKAFEHQVSVGQVNSTVNTVIGDGFEDFDVDYGVDVLSGGIQGGFVIALPAGFEQQFINRKGVTFKYDVQLNGTSSYSDPTLSEGVEEPAISGDIMAALVARKLQFEAGQLDLGLGPAIDILNPASLARETILNVDDTRNYADGPVVIDPITVKAEGRIAHNRWEISARGQLGTKQTSTAVAAHYKKENIAIGVALGSNRFSDDYSDAPGFTVASRGVSFAYCFPERNWQVEAAYIEQDIDDLEVGQISVVSSSEHANIQLVYKTQRNEIYPCTTDILRF